MPVTRNLPIKPARQRGSGTATALHKQVSAPKKTRTDHETFLNLNLDPPSDTSSGVYSDLDELSLRLKRRGSFEYSDPDTEPEPDLDAGLDLEGEYLRKRIAHYKAEGPAKPKHTDWTQKLWNREAEFWKEYCRKIQADPEDMLIEYEAETFKVYLEWRKENSRIKKESAIKDYWKRLNLYHIDLTGYRIDSGVQIDIRNWIPSLGLDSSEKEKHAMYVQDLYAVLHALWVDDTKALHGQVRVQISLLLILSAATGTRPGALVESGSAKGSNKALQVKDIELMSVRDLSDREHSTIVANVNLEHIKNSKKDGKPKKFTFRLENLPAFCIISHILAIGVSQNAFEAEFTCIEDIFNLKIPEHRDMWRIKWKREEKSRPFFCDFEKTADGIRVSKEKAFPYGKYRDVFVRLGRVAGFEMSLELYQLRRASGRNLNSALTQEERNQVMGHLGSTFERFYMPRHIARDFQSIYFGSPPQDLLIQSVVRMGLSRDRHAPVELNDDQLDELRNDPKLVGLRNDRALCRKEIHDRGYSFIREARGTDLHNQYEGINRKINSTFNKLHREQLDKAIRDFHDSIDTKEINKQLRGETTTDVLVVPTVEYEIRERATVAGLLFKPLSVQNAKVRIKFIYNLARLCHRQETRRRRALKRKKTDFILFKGDEGKNSGTLLNKRTKYEAGDERGLKGLSLSRVASEKDEATGPYLGVSDAPFTRDGRVVAPMTHRVGERPKLEPAESKADNVELVRPPPSYPMILPHRVCLICIGDDQFSYEERMKEWPRKDVLNKHIDTHFRWPKYQKEFECRHPECSTRLDGKMHFKRHGHDVHHVVH